MNSHLQPQKKRPPPEANRADLTQPANRRRHFRHATSPCILQEEISATQWVLAFARRNFRHAMSPCILQEEISDTH